MPEKHAVKIKNLIQKIISKVYVRVASVSVTKSQGERWVVTWPKDFIDLAKQMNISKTEYYVQLDHETKTFGIKALPKSFRQEEKDWSPNFPTILVPDKSRNLL